MTFERLPGRKRGLLSSHTAWLAADQLVLVRRTGYREVYRRVELRDVQAVVQIGTRSWLHEAAVLAMLLAATVIGAAFASGGFRIFWSSISALLLAGLAVDLVRGPSCRVHLRTPIDWIELPSLPRVRVAERALARLAERVTQTQGVLSTAEARSRLAEVVPLLAPPTPLTRGVGTAVGQDHANSADHRWHTLLAALLLGEIVVSAAQSAIESTALDVFGTLYGLLQICIAIVVVATQARKRVGPALQRWGITSLVTLVVVFVVCTYGAALAAIAISTAEATQAGAKPPAVPVFGVQTQLPPLVRQVASMVYVLTSAGLLTGWLLARRAPTGAKPASP